jgi:Fe-S-cluster formation regulator IscX/YfhJ
MANPLLALLAVRTLPRAQQVVRALRVAEVMRDLREKLEDVEEKTTRIQALEQRVTELERRADGVAGGKERQAEAAQHAAEERI